MEKTGILLLTSLSMLIAGSYYENGTLKTLTPEVTPRISQTSISTVGEPRKNDISWYITEQGRRIGVTKTILVKWNDISNSEALVKAMGFIKTEKLSNTIWELTIPEDGDVFLLSKELYEHGSTEFAHPNMLRERSMR